MIDAERGDADRKAPRFLCPWGHPQLSKGAPLLQAQPARRGTAVRCEHVRNPPPKWKTVLITVASWHTDMAVSGMIDAERSDADRKPIVGVLDD